MREQRQPTDFSKGSVDVQVRDAQVLCVAQPLSPASGANITSSYGNIIIESQPLIEINGDGFAAPTSQGLLACRLQVPTSDSTGMSGYRSNHLTAVRPRTRPPAKVSVLSSVRSSWSKQGWFFIFSDI